MPIFELERTNLEGEMHHNRGEASSVSYVVTYLAGLATLPALMFAQMAMEDWRWRRAVSERRSRNDFLRANGIDPYQTQATGRKILARIRAMRRH